MGRHALDLRALTARPPDRPRRGLYHRCRRARPLPPARRGTGLAGSCRGGRAAAPQALPRALRQRREPIRAPALSAHRLCGTPQASLAACRLVAASARVDLYAQRCGIMNLEAIACCAGARYNCARTCDMLYELTRHRHILLL